LKVSLVLETDDEGAEALQDSGFYVQDVLNTFLRSVDVSVLEDPASMSRLRAQILRRIRAIVPDAEVTNVLITEFVLT
jgi:flagellar FliL protein